MKAYIISYHDSHDYGTRIKYLEKFLHSNGYDTLALVSDFNHMDKCEYKLNRLGTKLIHVSPYSKNLSVARIKSYEGFAKSCSDIISKDDHVDLVYVLAPPNLLIKELASLKSKKGYKLIVEIGDMWPESMPIPSSLKKVGKPAFEVWRRIRDKNINRSDYVITECDLFKVNLIKNGLLAPCKRIYFCKEALFIDSDKVNATDEIRFCYIGSINNIIDIDYIGKLVKSISNKKNVRVDIIGKGENENKLCEVIESSGGICVFHGAIYDNNRKYEIVSSCHFALNIMKDSVFVGMTMKSLDYFSAGLPIINNIVGDTWDVVDKFSCGINGKSPEEVAQVIIGLNEDKINQFRVNARNVHTNLFSIAQYEKQMVEILKTISEDL